MVYKQFLLHRKCSVPFGIHISDVSSLSAPLSQIALNLQQNDLSQTSQQLSRARNAMQWYISFLRNNYVYVQEKED